MHECTWRRRREIGRDLEARTNQADQVGRIIEMTSTIVGTFPSARGALEDTEDLIALLAGAAALLRETANGMRGLETELIASERNAGQG